MLDEEIIRMKCPTCGAVGKGKAANLKRQFKCPKCGKMEFFVRVLSQSGTAGTVSPAKKSISVGRGNLYDLADEPSSSLNDSLSDLANDQSSAPAVSKTPLPRIPLPVEQEPQPRSIFEKLGPFKWVAVAAVPIVVGLCIGGYFLFRSPQNGPANQSQPITLAQNPAPIQTPAPTPTSSPVKNPVQSAPSAVSEPKKPSVEIKQPVASKTPAPAANQAQIGKEEYKSRLEAMKKEFTFVPIENWRGMKFIFLQSSLELRKYGYQSFKGGTGSYGQPTYEEAVGRIGTITNIRYRNSIYEVYLKMDDDGHVYVGSAYTNTLNDVAPMADIQKAAALWKGKTLWLKCSYRMSEKISVGIQKYPEADKFDAFAVRRFSPVKVVNVEPSRNFRSPVRFILETESGEKGFEDCSLSGTNGWVDSEELKWDFEDHFFIVDPRTMYSWDEEIWKSLEERKLKIGMTIEQVLICWGYPKNHQRTTTAKGTQMKFLYPGGTLLIFEDDKLTTIQD